MPLRRPTLRAALLAALPAAPTVLRAQVPAPPPSAPSAGHEPLAFFEGLWTVAGSPPAREFRERCGWMEGGRRHVVCRARSRAASGDGAFVPGDTTRYLRLPPAP